MNASVSLKHQGTGLEGKRILVLEDRLVSQIVVLEQLRKFGLDCTLAVNGVEALAAFTAGQFDLVLCDCSMPEMSGYDFTRALRRQELPGQRIPVVALTANNLQDDAANCAEAGMDDFLSKPVTADQLAAVLFKWLSPLEAPPATSDFLHAATTSVVQAIDIKNLTEILGADDVTVVNWTLEESLATVGKSFSEVEAAMTSGDPDHLTIAVRNAKGEARCTAATGLSDLYAKLEHSIAAGDRTASRELVGRAAIEVRRVEDFIRSRLGVGP